MYVKKHDKQDTGANCTYCKYDNPDRKLVLGIGKSNAELCLLTFRVPRVSELILSHPDSTQHLQSVGMLLIGRRQGHGMGNRLPIGQRGTARQGGGRQGGWRN